MKIYYPYSSWLKARYGQKVYKLPVNLPLSCPNRQGSGAGCTFCSALGTGFEAADSAESITDQLRRGRELVSRRYKAQKYIAYFQNYTNTFMSMDDFRSRTSEAAAFPDVLALSISTRPDCIRRDYLEWLQALREDRGVDIHLELGLQTANYHTLDAIERGHSLAEYIDAMLMVKAFPFTVCTHLIGNLPGDTVRDAVETARIVSVLHTDVVKIHSLYIARGTAMARDYEAGRLTVCDKQEYFERLRAILENLDPAIAVERLFGRIPEEEALFCNWRTSWWRLRDEFESYMDEMGSYQGKLFDYTGGAALKGVFK